jgi:ribosomal protein S18 acetylase RimI-like enzyme
MISITPLQADQIKEAASLHKAAFTGYLNVRIGDAYIRAFLRWFQQEQDGIALCAVTEEGKIVGYVVGAPVGYNVSLTKKTLLPALMGMMVRPWLFFDSRFRRVVAARLLDYFKRAKLNRRPTKRVDLPWPVFSLVGIAVSPSGRGQGIGKQLIAAFEQEVLARGGRTGRLSVYPDNAAARKLYERAGWQPYSYSDDPKQAMYYFKIFA